MISLAALRSFHVIRWCILALTALLCSCATVTQPTPPLPPNTVHLAIEPIVDGQGYRGLNVAITFPASTTNETQLLLPNEWAGEAQLYRFIHDLRADNASLEAGAEPHSRLIRHAPNAQVTLRYRVAPALDGPNKPKAGNDYRPIFEASYFHLLGNAFVIHPTSVRDDAPARFSLSGMPAGATFASDLEHQARGRAMTMSDLNESVLVGGDFRLMDVGGDARLAIRGQWPRDDAEWARVYSQIATAEREYWGTAAGPFLVTVLPTPIMTEGASAVGGTGRSDAFAFFATPNADLKRIDKGMAHEMMHTWVPRRIGKLPDKDEQLHYWLSEGFTDWTSWRVMVRSGLWTAGDFATAFNEAVRDYDQSPAKIVNNSTVLEKFWTDSNVQRLPYRRGMLIATYWNHQVQRATQGKRSFDDVLLAMQRMAARTPSEAGRAVAYLTQAMQEVAGIDIKADLAAYIERGEPAPLPENIFAPCGGFPTRERPVFQRGFDVHATAAAGNVIKGVAVDGPAYRAGLRDGMKLLKRSGGVVGDSEVEIRYDLMDGETQRTLTWLPAGKEREAVRELILAPAKDDSTRRNCLKHLGA
jgi:predicted metalloprotease with PDZ domain